MKEKKMIDRKNYLHKYYLEHKEQYAEWCRKWRKEHKDAAFEISRRNYEKHRLEYNARAAEHRKKMSPKERYELRKGKVTVYTKKYYTKERKEKNQKAFERICLYEGEYIRWHTLGSKFRYYGIENPFKEANKYLVKPIGVFCSCCSRKLIKYYTVKGNKVICDKCYSEGKGNE